MSLPWWLFGLRGPGPGAFRLQGEASPWCSPTEQDISLQQESVRVNTPLCVCPPLVCPQQSHSCCQPPPPPPGTPQDEQPGLPQALMRLLLRSGISVGTLQEPSLLPQPCGALAFKPLCPSEPRAPGAPPPDAGPQAGARPGTPRTHSWGRAAAVSPTHSRVWVPRPANAGFGCTSSAPSCRLVMISSLCLWM